ncbi:HNH endonuclease [Streptomyces sp. R302]|nr:HNH endonuclease [Streptomyces sp. R301]NML79267.1 HNH endonuclease [Streptomyces sp. R302]
MVQPPPVVRASSRRLGRARSRRRAARNDAAARLRRIIARKGSAWCDWCLDDFPAADVDVDHVRPLSMGGTDTDGNVQVLCRGCHQLKTGTEFGRAS